MVNILTKEGLKHFTAGIKAWAGGVVTITINKDTSVDTAVRYLTDKLNANGYSFDGTRGIIVSGDSCIMVGFVINYLKTDKLMILDHCSNNKVKKIILTQVNNSWGVNFVEE
jgi:hypothetical protein